jgi:glycerol uptake facilitator-like aquaporin
MLARRAVAELVGAALLLIAVVGSGIAAERLSPDAGIQLLVDALVSGATLTAVILAVGPVSGAHLNPVVTLADRALGGIGTRQAGVYIAAQLGGAVVGTVVANLIFSLPAVELSTRSRASAGLWLGEVVATFGLALVVFGVVRSGRRTAAPLAVGAYVFAAVLFTSSTSFANPAVTMARSFSDTFTGIAPGAVGPFVLAQLVGGALAVAVIRILYPTMAAAAGDMLVPVVEDAR